MPHLTLKGCTMCESVCRTITLRILSDLCAVLTPYLQRAKLRKVKNLLATTEEIVEEEEVNEFFFEL